ncbi:MAG: hypothetical protein ACFE8A_09735 [Candidatus Hodarchaeota archaeon]
MLVKSPNIIILNIIIAIATSIILFLLSIFITRWRLITKDWGNINKSTKILNLFWFVVNIILLISFSFIIYGFFLALIISTLINLLIGTYIASKIYSKEYKESITLVLGIIVYLFIIGLIIYFIIMIIFTLIFVGLAIS